MLHRKYITEPACMCAAESMNNMWCRERGGRISEILMNIIIRGDGRPIKKGVGEGCDFKNTFWLEKMAAEGLHASGGEWINNSISLTRLICSAGRTTEWNIGYFIISVYVRIIFYLWKWMERVWKTRPSCCFLIRQQYLMFLTVWWIMSW